jgi:uncharacterized protein involved in outer membrane biogenesis
MRLLHGVVGALGALLAIVVGLAALALGLVVLIFDINSQKSWLTANATTLLGREMTLEGNLDLDWSWTPRLTINDLTVANAEWGEAPYLAHIDRLAVALDLWRQLQGTTKFTLIEVDGPDIRLERNQEGQTNWSFGSANENQRSANSDSSDDGVEPGEVASQTAEEATIPEDRTEIPIIDRLVIADGRFGFDDALDGIALQGKLQTALGDGGDGDRVEIEGEGSLKEKPLTIKLDAGSFAKLRDASEPYPVELELRFGETEATVEGTIDRPLDVAGLDIEWSLEGPSLDDVFQLTGVPLPPTPSYSLTGSLFHGEQLWRVSDLDGRLGDSDLGGTMEVDVGTDPLTFEADLVSDRLDIKDLGGFLGAPVEEDAEETEGLIPERELDLTRLNAANGHARLEAKSIIAPDLPLDDFTAELELQDGTLRLQPASFGVAQGTVDLWLSLYGSEPPVRTDILARVRGLHLKEAFRGSEFVQETGGEIDGRVELHGRGNSLQEILGSADGHSFLVMTGGKMSAMILELIGLDAAEALGLYFGDNGDTPVEIRCAATEFEVDGGIAEVKLGVLDTPDTLIRADGRVNFGKETMDFSFAPKPHDVSFLTLRSKLEISGQLEDPQVGIDAGSLLANMPPIDLGTDEVVPCDRLIEQARTEPEEKPDQ